MNTLKAKNISFSYGEQEPLLSDFSMLVRSNQRLALQAPSGFGKTTLCKIVAGYLEPDKGVVLLNDSPLRKKGKSSVQLIGQHPEMAVDPRLRMRETLKEAGEIDNRLLEDLEIRQNWLDRYPHELSGGELQRFCIARALMVQPSFLIADEISTMLDAVTQAQIWQFLIRETEKQNIGLIFVTHSLALTQRIATEILYLSH